ncbi:GxxExxY protein [Rhodohalobacter sp.]|uniref:GxxExxY protein n=1 Tax=Rhodohalobacter sp. TaxID=1974210 RepID=UPI002ACDDE49|nr:GxxExxY protein [Rhodohalobacter sp.]MDZ7756213.1 GxxExxY protein [Rhodohalobacter sp.]
MHENDISYAIRGAAFKVHTKLGPGLLESVYETALTYELRKEGFTVLTQLGVPVVYEEVEMEQGFRMDLLVNHKVIVEIKSVEALAEVHHKQLLTYLKLSNKKLGLLINFNVPSLKESIIRIVNNL